MKIAGLDIDNFDYKDFMQQFWGDASGDKFYSGQSGFKESKTSTFTGNLHLSLGYKHELFTAKLGSNIRREIVEYILNKDANVNTWNYKFTGQLQYDSKKQLSVISQMEYNFYEGYAAGFAQPSFLWNMELHKSIKSVTLSLYMKDILNQTSSFSRSTSTNYVEDSYKNIIGQHTLWSNYKLWQNEFIKEQERTKCYVKDDDVGIVALNFMTIAYWTSGIPSYVGIGPPGCRHSLSPCRRGPCRNEPVCLQHTFFFVCPAGLQASLHRSGTNTKKPEDSHLPVHFSGEGGIII